MKFLFRGIICIFSVSDPGDTPPPAPPPPLPQTIIPFPIYHYHWLIVLVEDSWPKQKNEKMVLNNK